MNGFHLKTIKLHFLVALANNVTDKYMMVMSQSVFKEKRFMTSYSM